MVGVHKQSNGFDKRSRDNEGRKVIGLRLSGLFATGSIVAELSCSGDVPSLGTLENDSSFLVRITECLRQDFCKRFGELPLLRLLSLRI